LTTLARFTLACAALAAAVAASPAVAPAAGFGIAYDSVTKFTQVGSGPAPAPGNFQADFQTASASPPPAPKLPFGLGRMAAAAQNAGNMFRNGTAERHYIGTTKERVDNVSAGTADITDCTARTLTHLDLNAKTYTVTSLDQPETAMKPSGNSHEAPGPSPTDDGTKLAIDMKTRALGPMRLDGIPTSGYDMNMKVTATKPNGDSSTFNSILTAYYSGYAAPHFSCDTFHGFAAGGPGQANGAQYAMIMRALAAEKGSQRFSVTNSGPPIPAGKLSLWELMTLNGGQQTNGQAASFAIETEKGNVRSISDADAAFSVPPDFKRI
jgi:hypothetical protein